MQVRALWTSMVCILAMGLSALIALPASAAPRATDPAPAAPTPAPAPAPAPSPSTDTSQSGGGAAFGVDPNQTPEMPSATIVDGKAYPPVGAPQEVKDAIWAANEIVGKPYKYGGGHARVKDTGYDCSGTVSYALRGGGLLDIPLDSSSFMAWGEAGPGDWITVYTNPSHAFVVIAGLRLDTSAAGDVSGNKGPQWRPILRNTKGFKARHLVGF